MSNSLELTRTFTSFSGVDIRAVIGGIPIGQLQAISYAVQREKAPIYVMGRVDPLSFSRGKRGIAGTIITLMLDQHILFSDTFSQLKFIADNDEIFPNVGDLNEADYSNAGNFNLNDLDEVSTASFTPSDLSSGFTASVLGMWIRFLLSMLLSLRLMSTVRPLKCVSMVSRFSMRALVLVSMTWLLKIK